MSTVWDGITDRILEREIDWGTVTRNISEVPILEVVLGGWKIVLTRNRGKAGETTRLHTLLGSKSFNNIWLLWTTACI